MELNGSWPLSKVFKIVLTDSDAELGVTEALVTFGARFVDDLGVG